MPQPIENLQDFLESKKDLPETCSILGGSDLAASLTSFFSDEADHRITRIFMNARDYADLRQFGLDTLEISSQATLLKTGKMGELCGAEVYVSREIKQRTILLEWWGDSIGGLVKARILLRDHESAEPSESALPSLLGVGGAKNLAPSKNRIFRWDTQISSTNKNLWQRLGDLAWEVGWEIPITRTNPRGCGYSIIFSEFPNTAARWDHLAKEKVLFEVLDPETQKWRVVAEADMSRFRPNMEKSEWVINEKGVSVWSPVYASAPSGVLSTIVAAVVSGAGMAVANQLGKAVANAVGVPMAVPALVASASEPLRAAAQESVAAQTFEFIQGLLQ